MLSVFHFDISGNDIKEEHPLNKWLILLIFLISHLSKSGKEIKDLQEENMPHIFITLDVFHFDISGNDTNCSHPENR